MSMKVKFMRKMLKRPYGIVYFKLKKTLYPKIMDFSKDSATVNGGFYILEKDSIVIQKDGTKKNYKIEDFQSWNEGYPILFFDVNDCIPLRFEHDLDRGEVTRPHPQAIQAIIKKELQAAEAEIMRKQRSVLFRIMVVVLIAAVFNFFFTIMAWNDIGKIITHFAIK